MKLTDLHPDLVSNDVCRAQLAQLRSDLDHMRPWSATQCKTATIDGAGRWRPGAPFFYQGHSPSDELLEKLRDTRIAGNARAAVSFATGGASTFSGADLVAIDVFATHLRQLAHWLPSYSAERLEFLATAMCARGLLSNGQHLHTMEVAALGSVTVDRVNTLAREGKVRRIAHGLYDNKSVKQWLKSGNRRRL